jgi:hypothetical protein
MLILVEVLEPASVEGRASTDDPTREVSISRVVLA